MAGIFVAELFISFGWEPSVDRIIDCSVSHARAHRTIALPAGCVPPAFQQGVLPGARCVLVGDQLSFQVADQLFFQRAVLPGARPGVPAEPRGVQCAAVRTAVRRDAAECTSDDPHRDPGCGLRCADTNRAGVRVVDHCAQSCAHCHGQRYVRCCVHCRD